MRNSGDRLCVRVRDPGRANSARYPAGRASARPRAGLTAWLLCTTSALFAVASGAGSLVGVLQALLVGRAMRRLRVA